MCYSLVNKSELDLFAKHLDAGSPLEPELSNKQF